MWASPVTFFALVYALTFQALKYYEFHKLTGDTLVWKTSDHMPEWLVKRWLKWGGHTFGNVVVVKNDPDVSFNGHKTLVHESQHVRQYMILGVFFLPIYGLNWLVIKLACPHSDPYWSNCLEVDARRAADQVADVEGTVMRAFKSGKLSAPK